MDSRKVYRLLKTILITSTILLVWLASFHLAAAGIATLPKVNAPIDLATTLLSAAAIAIFIFSLLVTMIAIYVWYTVENKMRAAVKEETAGQLEKIGNEVRGRTHAALGYIIGELSVDDDYLESTDVERLREAIYYCEKAYEHLKNSGIPTEFMNLNNLLQYYCISGYTSRRGYLLEGARRLRAAAEEHGSPNLLLTYAKTTLTFGLEPKEIDEACSIVADIIAADAKSRPILNEKQRREAEQLASLCQKRTSGSPEVNKL
jgi:hypothetical protein